MSTSMRSSIVNLNERWLQFRPMSAALEPGYTCEARLERFEDARQILQRCNGEQSIRSLGCAVDDCEEPSLETLQRVSEIVREGICAGLIESLEAAALREVLTMRSQQSNPPYIQRVCTGDYFTAVELSDGSQGAAINFNNVSGPHKTSFNYRHFDSLLERLMQDDPILERSFLRWFRLDPLGKSVKIAVLNALSTSLATAQHAATHGLRVEDGYLNLVARLKEGDTVAMIGCTGNYSCPEVGQATCVKRVLFSDFEYTGHFKAGIERCIERFFHNPAIVEYSDGSQNQQICREADVVIIIADTLCTNTLDELIGWSANAREILVTGRSYVMNPLHAFERGVTGLTMQRIVVPSLVDFVHAKLARAEYGFTDSLVECFQRVFVTNQQDVR